MKLEGKVAAITGGGSGMGRAIALAFAREGARVVIADVNLAAAQTIADEIVAGSGEALAVQTDVRDQTRAQAMVDAAVEAFGSLDVLVNNAGVGKIINLASQPGRHGEALVLAYRASKARVISMTRSMALALAPHKINVNGIAPGIIETPFWVEVDKQFAKLLGWEVGEPKRKFVESIPLGRIEQPEDVTGAAIFLASSDSDYITQQTLNVDGGNWPG